MKTITVIAVGLLVAANCKATSAAHFLSISPPAPEGRVQQQRLQLTAPRKGVVPVEPGPMLGLPRQG